MYGTLGDVDSLSVRLNLKEGAEYVHIRLLLVPHVHTKFLFKDIQRVVAIGIVRKDFDLPCVSPTIIIPKPNKTMQMVSYFKKVNSKLIRKHFQDPIFLV